MASVKEEVVEDRLSPQETGAVLTKVEDALEKLGGYSRFQIIATIFISFLEVAAAMVSLSPILTSRTDVEFICETHDNITVLSKQEICNYTCDGKLTSKQAFHSVVEEWSLVCDKAWIPEVFTSIQMFGGLFGSIIVASFADRYGRKKAFFSIATLLGLSGFLCVLSPNPYFYGAARFISGFAAAGSFVAHFNYLMEFLTPPWRTVCGCLSFWAIGEMLLGLVGYLSSSWKVLSWTSSVSAFLVFAVFFVLPESPRFLLCKRRTKEAHEAFNQIAKVNSKPPLEYSQVVGLQDALLKEEVKAKLSDSWKVFKDKRVRISILIFFFGWFSNAIVYFGLSFNTKNLEGNIYLNVFFLGLVDFPAELSSMYFNNRFGRRKTFSLSLVASSFFLIVLVFVEIYSEDKYPALIILFCLLGRFFNEFSWAVMACFTGESFPTIGRSVCLSICTCASAIGGIIAPQMAYLGSVSKVAPYIIFCGLSVISAILSFQLTEMKGKPLEDTVKIKATKNIQNKL